MNILGSVRSMGVQRFVELTFASSLCIALAGCGNGLAQVSGVVTLDGQPIHGGSGDTRVTVQFQPASGTGSTAIGLADEHGVYAMSTGSQNGIPPGEYVVTCSASQLVASKLSEGQRGVRQISDAKFANSKTSGLRCTVQPGKNEFNISVSSPPKSASRPGT